jgi:hypothetical protein
MLFTGQALACDSVDGSVAKIDTARSALVMTTSCCQQKEMTFVLKKDTKVLVNGKVATLADLRTGDKVQIDYEKLDDVLAVKATREG